VTDGLFRVLKETPVTESSKARKDNGVRIPVNLSDQGVARQISKPVGWAGPRL